MSGSSHDRDSGDARQGGPRVGLIWAQAHGRVIGARGGMPWHVPEDLRHFKTTTFGAPVIMGRRTWESFPPRFRPLPGRRNVVVTSSRPSDAFAGAERAASLDDALGLVSDAQVAWVIGGARLFGQALAAGVVDVIERTDLDLDVAGDTFAPAIPSAFRETGGREWHLSRSGVRYRFRRFVRAE